jgi:hypothetical protein
VLIYIYLGLVKNDWLVLKNLCDCVENCSSKRQGRSGGWGGRPIVSNLCYELRNVEKIVLLGCEFILAD